MGVVLFLQHGTKHRSDTRSKQYGIDEPAGNMIEIKLTPCRTDSWALTHLFISSVVLDPDILAIRRR